MCLVSSIRLLHSILESGGEDVSATTLHLMGHTGGPVKRIAPLPPQPFTRWMCVSTSLSVYGTLEFQGTRCGGNALYTRRKQDDAGPAG